MRRLALAACCLLAACGGEAPPSEAVVTAVVGEALSARRDLQSRFIDQRIGLATEVGFPAPSTVRLTAPPLMDGSTGRWRIRVAVSGAFTATLPPLPQPPQPQLPSLRPPAGPGDAAMNRQTSVRPPVKAMQPAVPQRISQDYEVRFDAYIDHQDGAWRLP